MTTLNEKNSRKLSPAMQHAIDRMLNGFGLFYNVKVNWWSLSTEDDFDGWVKVATANALLKRGLVERTDYFDGTRSMFVLTDAGRAAAIPAGMEPHVDVYNMDDLAFAPTVVSAPAVSWLADDDAPGASDGLAGVEHGDGTINVVLPDEDIDHADAKAELWKLLDHEAGADERIETALYGGDFSGKRPCYCAYGHALSHKAELEWPASWAHAVISLRYEITGWNSFSPLEMFVFDIHYGDTPTTSPRAVAIVRWIHEWRASQAAS